VLLPLLSWLLLHKRLHKKLLLQKQRLTVRLQQRLRLKKSEARCNASKYRKRKVRNASFGLFYS
jgi:hypothetical protein